MTMTYKKMKYLLFDSKRNRLKGVFSMYVKIIFMTVTILLSGQVFAQSTPTVTTKKKVTTPAAKSASTVSVTPAAEPTPIKESAAKPVETTPTAPTLTTTEQVLKYMKEKFTGSYHGEYYITRRLPFYEPIANESEKKVQDMMFLHNPTLVYKPTPNWQVLATAEFKYTDRPDYVLYPNTFFRSLFTLTRKNILTEKEDGLQLDAGIGRRQFNTGLAIAYKGNNRIFTTLSKSFGKTKSSLFLQYLNGDYKKATATTWDHAFEIIPSLTFQLTEKLTWLINDDIVINTPKFKTTERDYYMTHDMNIGFFTYQWDDKFSTYFQLKYMHLRYDFTKGYRTDLESIDYYMGASYSFTPKLSVTGEFGSQLFRASDNKDLFTENVKYPEFTVYLDYAL